MARLIILWRRWWNPEKPPALDDMVHLSVNLDVAAVMRKALMDIWNRKLQSMQTARELEARSHFAYEIACLERAMDEIDAALREHRKRVP